MPGRVKSVEVMEGGAWKPIDPAKTYIVATNNFVRQGGDGYKLFADQRQERLRLRSGPRTGGRRLPRPRTGPTRRRLDGRITEITAAGRGGTGRRQTAKPAEAPAPAAPAKPAEALRPQPRTRRRRSRRPVRHDIATTRRRPIDPPRHAPAAGRAPSQPSCSRASGKAEGSHVVVAGDNYWDIAEKFYGDGDKWKTDLPRPTGLQAAPPAGRRDA